MTSRAMARLVFRDVVAKREGGPKADRDDLKAFDDPVCVFRRMGATSSMCMRCLMLMQEEWCV